MIGNQRLKKKGGFVLHNKSVRASSIWINTIALATYFDYQTLLNVYTCAKSRTKTMYVYVASLTETVAKTTALAKFNVDKGQ